MPPFNVGFAQVEDRLRVVRRRLNLLTLQHALYLSGSLVTLAIALVIALALRGQGSFFAIAVWFAVASVLAAVAAAGLRLRQRWMSVEQAVHFADRCAGLDDRLATLLLDPLRGRASSLKDLLLQQVLAAEPRWHVDTLVPRRVPRSLFALLASLAALIVISFLARPPAIPSPIAARSAPHPNQPADDPAAAQPPPNSARVEGAGQLGAGAGPGAMQLAGLSGAPDRAPGADAGASTRSGMVPDRPGQAAAEHAPGSTSADRGRSAVGGALPRMAAEPPKDMTDKLQSAIRNAFGAETAEDRKLAAPAGARAEQRTAEQKPAPGERVAGAGAAADKKDGTSPSNSSAHQPGAGSAAAAGERGGEAPEQLFGSAPEARKVGSGGQNVSIKLGTFAALAPSQVEPQRHQPPVGEPVPSGMPPASQQPLADEQVADAPLQKAEVAPQHEALVRRIFTRDE